MRITGGCDGDPMCIDVLEDDDEYLSTKVYWSPVDDAVIVHSTTDSYASPVFFTANEVQRLIDALTVSIGWFSEADLSARLGTDSPPPEPAS